MLWLKLIWILLVISVLDTLWKKHGFAFYLSVEAVSMASELHKLFFV